jgi:Protein of unknown function (DUF3891)
LLLRPHEDALLAIGQASHAWISGQLARAWGNARFPVPDPREEVCLAAEQHDIGMAQWDLRPTLNPNTGLPHTFIELPADVHIGLWSAAPGKVMTQSLYAALLVSMHGTALQSRRELASLEEHDRALVTSYLERERAFQAELMERLGADREQVARNQQLVWAWDGISLALCLGWETLMNEVPCRGESAELEVRSIDAVRFSVNPWPFALDRLVVRCEGRPLGGPFETAAEMHSALNRARPVTLELALEPG